MSPMGFAVHRQARLYIDDDEEFGGDDWDHWSDQPSRVRPVPIWLCVFLVVSYIIAGAFLFSSWEGWSFLDSAYFCFITLTTIGKLTLYSCRSVQYNLEIIYRFWRFCSGARCQGKSRSFYSILFFVFIVWYSPFGYEF